MTFHERHLNVNIPKGVYAGQHIRLKGQGDAELRSGQLADLYLEISFESHSIYTIKGKDVYVDIPVTPWEAALGDQITVPIPSGKIKVTVPANSTHGRLMRLKGRGIPAKVPGDLYVRLQIALPAANTAEVRKAYENLKQVADFNPRKQLGV